MNILEIKQKVNCEISTETTDLESHKRDASIFEITPKAVAFPKNTAELQSLVKYCFDRKGAYPDLSLTARAAGTCMSGGGVGEGIVVDFVKNFNRILEVNNSSAIMEPGVYYRDLEKATLKINRIFPSYPASKALAAMGGIVNNNSGGEKSLSYGKTIDHTKSLEVVLSNGDVVKMGPLSKQELAEKFKLNSFEGEIYKKIYTLLEDNYELVKKAKPKVTKNSAGYELWEVWNRETFNLAKLLVGSQGTLGLVTKIELGLIEPRPHSRLLVMFIKDMENLGSIINTVLKYKPETFESFDDKTFKLAVKFAPSMLMRMKGNFFKLAWQFLPEFLLTVSGGIPKLLLLAEFTGKTEQECMQNLTSCERELNSKFKIQCHVTKSSEETEKYWTMRRESFNLLREKVKNLHTAPFIDDLIVPVESLPEFLPQLDEILKKYPSLIYTVAGHMGDANFHIIPLMDLSKPKELEIIPKLSDEVYDLVLRYKGSTTAEHNDGLIRGQYLEQMYGKEVFEIMKAVKKIFDPKDILNPHKKTEATWEYALSKVRAF